MIGKQGRELARVEWRKHPEREVPLHLIRRTSLRLFLCLSG